MLIPFDQIIEKLSSINMDITGALHIGAHECEEMPFYNKLGLKDSDIVWVDAINKKVEEAKNRGIPNVYNAVITDKDDSEVEFNISHNFDVPNNVESSSVLDFGTHSQEHPQVVFVDKVKVKTVTVDTFFERNNIDGSKCNFWNFDIQGAELMALKGASKSIQFSKAIYLEVNVKELYKGCGLIEEVDNFLAKHGFKRVITQITVHGWGDALYIKE
jgi:FkbM family methyltransferase